LAARRLVTFGGAMKAWLAPALRGLRATNVSPRPSVSVRCVQKLRLESDGRDGYPVVPK